MEDATQIDVETSCLSVSFLFLAVSLSRPFFPAGLSGGSLDLTCSGSTVVYQQWTDNTNLVCAGTANYSATGADQSCMQIVGVDGVAVGSMIIDCNSAAQAASSMVLIGVLALVARRAQQLL